MKQIHSLVAVVTLFAAGCHGVHQRGDEVKLVSPSGLRWIKIVAKGIE